MRVYAHQITEEVSPVPVKTIALFTLIVLVATPYGLRYYRATAGWEQPSKRRRSPAPRNDEDPAPEPSPGRARAFAETRVRVPAPPQDPAPACQARSASATSRQTRPSSAIR